MTKYIKIDTIGTDDTNALFEEICKNIIQTKSLKAKRDVLGMTGKDRHLEEHKVTINQLMSVIVRYQITCEIKISYEDKSAFSEPPVYVPEDDKHGLKTDIVTVDMGKQESEITNPELKDLTTANVVEKKNEETKGELPRIPDFLDF